MATISARESVRRYEYGTPPPAATPNPIHDGSRSARAGFVIRVGFTARPRPLESHSLAVAVRPMPSTVSTSKSAPPGRRSDTATGPRAPRLTEQIPHGSIPFAFTFSPSNQLELVNAAGNLAQSDVHHDGAVTPDGAHTPTARRPRAGSRRHVTSPMLPTPAATTSVSTT